MRLDDGLILGDIGFRPHDVRVEVIQRFHDMPGRSVPKRSGPAARRPTEYIKLIGIIIAASRSLAHVRVEIFELEELLEGSSAVHVLLVGHRTRGLDVELA